MCVCSWAMQSDLWSSVTLLTGGSIASFSYASLYTIFHTHNFVTHNFIAHNSSHTTCLTSRSSTTSFVFLSFPVPLQLLFLIIARSWLVGLSGPLFCFNADSSIAPKYQRIPIGWFYPYFPIHGAQERPCISPQASRLSNHVDAWWTESLALMSWCLHQHQESFPGMFCEYQLVSTCYAYLHLHDSTSDLSSSWITLGRTTAPAPDWLGTSDSWKCAIVISPAILILYRTWWNGVPDFIVFSDKPKEGFLINKNNYHPLTNIMTLPWVGAWKTAFPNELSVWGWYDNHHGVQKNWIY